MNRIIVQKYKKRLIVSFGSLIFTIFLTIMLDRSAGWILPVTGLIYPPDTTITYKTTEFEFVANINSLGFRGGSPDLARSMPTYRIMTLGDSFTYGWGVDNQAVWSTILAKNLNDKGVSVEVTNMGWVGKSPSEYADVAEKSIPLLKPDLVIVGILQGDDLQQLRRSKFSMSNAFRMIRKIYPNLSGLIQQVRYTHTPENLQQAWQYDAAQLVNQMSPTEMTRFQELDSKIKELFHQGLLNPQLISLSVHNPNYFVDMIDLTNPDTQLSIDSLTTELKRIKKIAQANQAEVIVIAIPYGIYINDDYLEKNRQLGFTVNPDMLSSTVPDEAITIAADRAGIKFISVLASFRQNSEHLFYDLDGHFTAAGNRLFAEELTPLIEREFQLYQSGKNS